MYSVYSKRTVGCVKTWCVCVCKSLSWARAPKHTHAKWQAKKKACIRVRKKSLQRKRNNYQAAKTHSERPDSCECTEPTNKWRKKEHEINMRNATEGLCSAATYYLLKGVCDETDRFNSHHVVSHAYNYPLSIRPCFFYVIHLFMICSAREKERCTSIWGAFLSFARHRFFP